MKTAVVALGKIGLPLAVQFADADHEVIGVDVNPRQVELTNQATEPFPGEAHLQEKLPELVPAGKLRATTDYAEAIPGADAVVTVVPLFVNDAAWEPDLAWMDAATRALAEHLIPGSPVSYETTLPVGTLRTRFEEISGLKESVDFFSVFSPKRVLPGRVFENLRKYPKLIGMFSEAVTRRAREFYESALTFDERPGLKRPNGVWDLGSPEASELAKLAETSYREVNIAVANEFALFAQDHGIDMYKVIEASNSQPYSHIHQPGIAVGVHSTPVYPRLYLSTDPYATTVRTARTLNPSASAFLAKRAASLLDSLQDLKAVVLGASYRTGVKVTAFSGVFPVVEALREHSAETAVHETSYDDEEITGFGRAPYQVGDAADLVIVQTNHPEYAQPTAADVPGVKLIVDGRNITTAENWASPPRPRRRSNSTHQQTDQK